MILQSHDRHIERTPGKESDAFVAAMRREAPSVLERRLKELCGE